MEESSLFSETFEHPASPSLYQKTRAFLIRHIALMVLVLFGLVGVWVLDDYGVGHDAGIQRGLAVATLDYLLGDGDALRKDYNKFYGVTFDLPLLLLERALGLNDTRDVHLMRHILTHMFFLLSGFFCYLLAYRLFENRLLAVLAMLIFLLHPRLYAHSFFNDKDIPFLSMFMICLYLTHRAFERGNVWRFLILGIATGVLINLRIMGITLFALVAGMQVLDLLHAHDHSGRSRVLASVTVFMLSTVLTVYVSMPYLWTDPIVRSMEWFSTSSHHPTNVLQIFRGELFLSRDIHPSEYVSVWFSITASPMTLVLGILGILAALRGYAVRFGDVLRDTRERFEFLLIGCFVLPIVTVIVLSANVYNGWRQMYFIYAPFCMLAAFGLHRLALFVHGRHLRVTMYSSAGAGIAAAVVAMASLHPHQHLYFNFLLDRATPGHLHSQYEMDYWLMTLREGYERLLERDPYGFLHVRLPPSKSVKLNWEILPKGDRERLIVQDSSFDFYITSYRDWRASESARRDDAASLIYDHVVYGSRVLGVAAMNLSMLDDAVAARYRDVYNATISNQPEARSDWDVYLDDTKLIYIKESCAASDLDMPFFLHVTPDDIDDLPEYRRHNGYATLNFDFIFGKYGVWFDGWCMAVVPLPDEGVSGIRTGQWTDGGELWGVAINLRAGGESAYRAEYESLIGETPAIESHFEVHLREGRLIYVKEPCDIDDVGAEFFLYVAPSDVGDLPPPRRESGFDNLDFIFDTRGLMFDSMCVASIGLPDYDVKRVTTGQFAAEIVLWEDGYNASAAAELPALVHHLRESGAVPVVSSHFDVYLEGRHLTYFKSPCAGEDAVAPFFVHLYPVDVDSLPPGRRSPGFESFSFDLLDDGVMSEDGCFTSFNLPDYDVAGFLTGQFVRGEANVWEGGHSFDAAELTSVVDRLRGGGGAVIRSHFDVYQDDGHLIYIRESCDASDVEAKFFLHVVPLDIDDLPMERREAGFDSLGFVFEVRGLMSDGICVASIALPDYKVKRIRTGQWDPEYQRNLWKEEFSIAGD